MGKGSKNKGNKNVFKVAGARSLKAKNKAKAVSTQLKKLTEGTKKKTVEVDNLLNDLQDTIRHTNGEKETAENPTTDKKPGLKNTIQEKLDKFNKTEETSIQALEKLDKMEV